jgi:hypothetical protein
MKVLLICASIFAVLSANANAEDRRVLLLAEATVQTETLLLSDLLPSDAGPRLKSLAEKVSLGRAPQPGSLRVFRANELKRVIAEAAELAGEFSKLELPEQVVVRRLGWPLEIDMVRQAIARSNLTNQIDFSEAPIVVPGNLTSRGPNPQLEVTAITVSPDRHHLLARVRCRELAACGTFLAEIFLNYPVPHTMRSGLKPVSEGLVSATSFLTRPARQAVLTAHGPVLVQPGHLALLVSEGDGFKITQPVMPLRRARLGELVRVSDPRTRRSWLAQVAGNGQLRIPGATRREETR